MKRRRIRSVMKMFSLFSTLRNIHYDLDETLLLVFPLSVISIDFGSAPPIMVTPCPSPLIYYVLLKHRAPFHRYYKKKALTNV